jgi:hypothetical protein
MASTEINPIDLIFNCRQFGFQFFQQIFRRRLPSDRHLPITLVMAFDATFLDGLKGVFLFRQDTSMTINAFDHIQLTTRSLFDANASFSLNELFDNGMAIITFHFLNSFPMMALRAIFHERFAVIFPGRMAIRTLLSVSCNVGFMGEFGVIKGNSTLLDPNMAQRGTGHLGFRLLGCVAFIDNR